MPGVTDANARRCAFCCDDRHIEDIVREGHMDNHLRKAVALGMNPVQAVTLCTLNASECFRLFHKGAIAPGRDADCILVDDLKEFRVRQVFAKGELVAEDGRMLIEIEDHATELPSSMCVGPLDESDLRIVIPSGKARVIGIKKHSLVTSELIREVRVDAESCFSCAANPGLVKLAVIERHKGTGKVGVGLLEGYGLRDGAIATTIAHDSHNIVVAGDSDTDILLAVREVVAMGGGIVTVKHGRVLGRLPLPIAGLMSREDPLKLSDALKEMLASARTELGISQDVEPFMALSFMALPVIPELKLTARGLFDVMTFSFVSLDVE